MSNLFLKAKASLTGTPWVFVVFALFVYAGYHGVQFFLEDYAANIETFAQIPTLKANPEMDGIMARFLQIAPLIFGFGWLRNMDDARQGLLALGFLVFDWAIGIYYRSSFLTLAPAWIAWAAAEDLVYFTVGSEVLIALSVGTLGALLPDVVSQIRGLVDRAFRALAGTPAQKPLMRYRP